jgi:GT2 family glycosyltransferase
LDFDCLPEDRARHFDYAQAEIERCADWPRAKTPRFSYVIPFRDRDETLPAVLRALKAAGEDGAEVLLVDDGSAAPAGSATRAALHELRMEWSLVRLPPAPLFRAGFARSVGAMHARGEYLIFLDSDILIGPDFLREVQSSLGEADLVQGRRWQIWADERPAIDGLPDRREEPNPFWCEFFNDPAPWMQRPQPWRYVSTYCLALRRHEFARLGGFRVWFAKYGFEDTDLGLRAHRRGLRLALSSSDVFHLSPHPRDAGLKQAGKKRGTLMRESARRYFVLNDAVESLDWLTHLMF